MRDLALVSWPIRRPCTTHYSNGFFCCHASSSYLLRVNPSSCFRNLAGLGILRHFARVGSQEAAKAEAPREAHENSLRTENREREQGAALDYRFQPSSDQPEGSGAGEHLPFSCFSFTNLTQLNVVKLPLISPLPHKSAQLNLTNLRDE